jgi:hypothetical protein
VDQRADVILDQLGLRGADPIGDCSENLGQQQHGAHERGRKQNGPETCRIAMSSKDGDGAIDEGACQVDGRDRKQSLDDEQDSPSRGPPAGRLPDQRERAGQVVELGRSFAELGGENRVAVCQGRADGCRLIT